MDQVSAEAEQKAYHQWVEPQSVGGNGIQSKRKRVDNDSLYDLKFKYKRNLSKLTPS
jgi:hypothetical protein